MIPPKANAAFVAAMEDVLDVYTRPYDPARPLVCLDETSKQLTRAMVLGIDWVCVWRALTNLSGRKPRVQGAARLEFICRRPFRSSLPEVINFAPRFPNQFCIGAGSPIRFKRSAYGGRGK